MIINMSSYEGCVEFSEQHMVKMCNFFSPFFFTLLVKWKQACPSRHGYPSLRFFPFSPSLGIRDSHLWSFFICEVWTHSSSHLSSLQHDLRALKLRKQLNNKKSGLKKIKLAWMKFSIFKFKWKNSKMLLSKAMLVLTPIEWKLTWRVTTTIC